MLQNENECFDVAIITNKGGKQVNEDSVFVKQTENGIIACVADGLGSHGGGDVASKAVVAVFGSTLPNVGYSDDAVIKECFTAANAAVIANQTAETSMKSTAVALFAEGDTVKFAHIGDSRGYLFANGKITTQTLDHSVAQMSVFRGDITPAEVRFHPKRNQVMQALGAGDNVEITALTRAAKMAFLLCSDGFWEYVNENEMELDLAKSVNAEQWLSFMNSRLSERVPADHDNVSAIAIIEGA